MIARPRPARAAVVNWVRPFLRAHDYHPDHELDAGHAARAKSNVMNSGQSVASVVDWAILATTVRA